MKQYIVNALGISTHIHSHLPHILSILMMFHIIPKPIMTVNLSTANPNLFQPAPTLKTTKKKVKLLYRINYPSVKPLKINYISISIPTLQSFQSKGILVISMATMVIKKLILCRSSKVQSIYDQRKIKRDQSCKIHWNTQSMAIPHPNPT